MKVFFSKIWQELLAVALPNQEKIAFHFKRISVAIKAKKNKSIIVHDPCCTILIIIEIISIKVNTVLIRCLLSTELRS
jgi:hypothetical protein